ncbi:MAG: 30S ribosomal protein S9 [Candidatus Absconditabacteria bacterium]
MDKKTTRSYKYAVGRRKESTAIVKLYPKGKGNFVIVKEDKTISMKDFFGGNKYLLENSLYPFLIMGNDAIKTFDADIVIRGGGIRGQSDSIRLGFSRALIEFNPELKKMLKPYGLLKRNPAVKERKKPGLKKARRAPQWSKR